MPLAIGGANVVANLWPEPWAEAVQRTCSRSSCSAASAWVLPQAEAQREVADDWAAAYTRYVGGVPVGAPDVTGPMASSAPARPTVKARLKAAAIRLARRWVFGFE